MFMGFLAETVANGLDLTAITNALTGSLNAGAITKIIATCLGSSVGLALTWFGARKLISSVMAAFKKGKVKA